MNKISTDLSGKLKSLKISTSTFVDIMDGLKTGSVLSHKLQSQNLKDYYFAGQAYTVQWKIVRKSNSILEPFPSTREQVKGCGAVRDGRDLNALSIPVIATNLTPTDTQGAYYVSGTGGCCQIEQTTTHNNVGDYP